MALINFDDNSRITNVLVITEEQNKSIRDFLQGAVYCWCKSYYKENYEENEGWFSMRDLMGDENFHWQGTPLFALHIGYEEYGSESPKKEAGKAAGRLLKRVIIEDRRYFEVKEEEHITKYRWVLRGDEEFETLNEQ